MDSLRLSPLLFATAIRIWLSRKLSPLISACSTGKVEDQLVLDLSDLEDKYGKADMPVALMPNFNNITLLQMDGELTMEEFNKCLDIAIDACRKINDLQKEALKTKYSKTQNKGGS